MQTSTAPDVRSTARADLPSADLRPLRAVLGAQILLGLLWGISMLFFARQIALGDPAGPHVEKIAIEGGAHFALVFAAILAWRSPLESRSLLLTMIFLNGLWALTDIMPIPHRAIVGLVIALLAVWRASAGPRVWRGRPNRFHRRRALATYDGR